MENSKQIDWTIEENKNLIDAFLSISSRDQAKRFFRDLMTESEITEFAKRLQSAILLSDKVPYSKIENETGFSSTTVARVSKWLTSGTGGYKEIISKLNVHPPNPSQIGKGLSLTRT